MTAVLSNQKIIDEIRDIQDSYIKTRPKMEMSVFKPTRFGEYNLGDERGGRHHLNMAMRQGLSMIHPLAPAAANLFINKSHGGMMGSGSPAFQKHPLSYGNINGNTLHPDPLYSGVVYQKYKNTKGGALLEKSMPLTGESESDTDSESDEGGDIMSESSEGEFSSDEEGELGGRRKSAGKISNLVKTRQMAPAKGGSKIGDMAKQAGQAIYKVINTAEAKGLAEGAIKTAIMGVLTAYFGPTGTTVGAVGISEIDKLRRQFGNKDKGRGISNDIKETASSVKKRLKPIGDAIYKAVVSEEAKALGKVALIGLITSIIGYKTYQLSKEIGAFANRIDDFSGRDYSSAFGQTIFKPKTKSEMRREQLREESLARAAEFDAANMGRPSPLETFHSPLKKDEVDLHIDDLQEIANELNPFRVDGGKGLKKKKSQPKKLVGTKKGNKARGDIVAEIMKKKGLSLSQASKYVKDHQLY